MRMSMGNGQNLVDTGLSLAQWVTAAADAGLQSVWPSTLENWLDCVQAFLTIVALLLAGLWFWRRRRLYPKATLSHKIDAKPLGDSHIFLRVTAILQNTGDVRISIKSGYTRIRNLPGPSEDISHLLDKNGHLQRDHWARAKLKTIDQAPLRQAFEVEPTETDEFAFDFAVDPGVGTIVVETALRNEAKRESGERPKRWKRFYLRERKSGEMSWTLETVYELPDLANRGAQNTMQKRNQQQPARPATGKQQPARPSHRPPAKPPVKPTNKPGRKPS